MAEETKSKGTSMNLQDIQKLIAMLEKSNLHELELETGSTKIRLSKGVVHAPAAQTGPQFVMMPQGAHSPAPAAAFAPQAAALPLPVPALAEGPPVPPPPQIKAVQGVEVKSPMVGTFYRSPAPGAEPFVKIGGRVKKGQTLCIIEAMKLLNEIECELDGVIVDILTENAQPVEYGEVLMHVDPDG